MTTIREVGERPSGARSMTDFITDDTVITIDGQEVARISQWLLTTAKEIVIDWNDAPLNAALARRTDGHQSDDGEEGS